MRTWMSWWVSLKWHAKSCYAVLPKIDLWTLTPQIFGHTCRTDLTLTKSKWSENNWASQHPSFSMLCTVVFWMLWLPVTLWIMINVYTPPDAGVSELPLPLISGCQTHIFSSDPANTDPTLTRLASENITGTSTARCQNCGHPSPNSTEAARSTQKTSRSVFYWRLRGWENSHNLEAFVVLCFFPTWVRPFNWPPNMQSSICSLANFSTVSLPVYLIKHERC